MKGPVEHTWACCKLLQESGDQDAVGARMQHDQTHSFLSIFSALGKNNVSSTDLVVMRMLNHIWKRLMAKSQEVMTPRGEGYHSRGFLREN